MNDNVINVDKVGELDQETMDRLSIKMMERTISFPKLTPDQTARLERIRGTILEVGKAVIAEIQPGQQRDAIMSYLKSVSVISRDALEQEPQGNEGTFSAS